MKGETMTLTKSLLTIISALALATGAAFAREELSLTEPGTGEELLGSYEVTSEGDVISSERFSEPMNGSEALASSEQFSEPMNGSDLLASSEEFSEPMNGSDALALEQGGELIYYSEAIVLVPSVDTETPQG
jgi:hypothetical protein